MGARSWLASASEISADLDARHFENAEGRRCADLRAGSRRRRYFQTSGRPSADRSSASPADCHTAAAHPSSSGSDIGAAETLPAVGEEAAAPRDPIAEAILKARTRAGL